MRATCSQRKKARQLEMSRSPNVSRRCRCARRSRSSACPMTARTKPRPIRAAAASRSRHFEATAMKLEKSFDINRPREAVWDAFGDVHLVAACLPGASITDDLGAGNYKGKFAL